MELNKWAFSVNGLADSNPGRSQNWGAMTSAGVEVEKSINVATWTPMPGSILRPWARAAFPGGDAADPVPAALEVEVGGAVKAPGGPAESKTL